MATPTQQVKKAGQSTRAAAEAATRGARQASQDVPRNLGTIARDSAYAWIGAGDFAVSVVRHLGEKAAELRADAPQAVRSGVDPREVAGAVERSLTRARTDVTREFERLSDRGRGLVESIQRSGATRQAVSQFGTARSQVKAAATSAGRATRKAGEAVEDTVERVGDDSPVDYDAKNLDELKEIARERQISGRSSMNRDQLVSALENS
jgi:hypothetical protein